MEVLDSNKVFVDSVFDRDNKHIAETWVSIKTLYPNGAHEPLLPDVFSRDQFGQGNHYECFMLSALSTLVNFPDVIRNCFVTKKARQDGRYTFQFFRGKEWVKVEVDDRIAVEDDDILYISSPSQHWWPLLLEKAYAKFYQTYDHLEGCTLQETYHDLTGLPVLNIPMDPKLAKAASCEVTEGAFWLDLASKVSTGQFVASVLTKDMEIESMGLQREQQYGVLEIFSLTGTSSTNDIVIRLHNPFEDEEYTYTGPMNPKDGIWTPKLIAKHNVDDPRSIFMPLNTFLKIMNSLQLCYITRLEPDATFYDDQWLGETAGGNPTSVNWRKNPTYLVRNTGSTPVEMVVVIKQEDQRRFTPADEVTKYLQCGLVLVSYVYPNPIVTKFITGNNHKPIHKSLFLNSRDVANSMTVPPNSLSYLVPSCMLTGAAGPFTLALYRLKDIDYSNLTVNKLDIPNMNWAAPATRNVLLHEREKDRVDFYVDEETDVHILLHQEKPFISKSGGDAMTEDYLGMYLYDDRDHKIGGVHAATNFREVSIIHHVPRSGRYAISLTCPRGKGDVPAVATIVGSFNSHLRIVDAPPDATMFDDDDEIVEDGEGGAETQNIIDFQAAPDMPAQITEVADSSTPFEDTRFMLDNKNVTSEPWVHIGDLYPEGKTLPLLPDVLSHSQFEQGEHFECCCLTAFAALVDHHPDVIRKCFVSKKPRKDGRYTFQFHRYGQWVKVEIDDRIPQMQGNTLYCRSPTKHWWPLLLEKACAKFYTLYQNLEGCTQQELFHDFSGRPVISVPMDAGLAEAAMYDVTQPQYWLDINDELNTTSIAALTKLQMGEVHGMQDDQSYAVLGCVPMHSDREITSLSELMVKLYNPFEEVRYTGPMNVDDARWTTELRRSCTPENKHFIYMPVDVFCDTFLNMQQAYVKGPLEPSWHFNSEWGVGTSGGNPTLITWRENPLYVVHNNDDEPKQIVAMIRQPDKRHMLHRQTSQELNYIQCGLILAESTAPERVPTYLVTGNNHRTVHKGLFLNAREVSNVVTIPSSSMCYLVPSAMLQDKGKFILSYWYLNKEDQKKMTIERLNTKVARHLPAIDHMELHHGEKHRTDFIVDTPTDVHILVRQEKAFKTLNGGDAMAEDFIAMYLYDSSEKRICGTRSATNYREIALVHSLKAAGQYALSVTCPRGNGNVPCRVEIVALEAAHVRIADIPDDARDLGEIDLGFLDPLPQGVPLADIALENDPTFQQQLDEMRQLHNDPLSNADQIAQLEHLMNERAHELAKGVLGKDRPKYLSNNNLEKLNRFLDDDPNYMEVEKDRYMLKKDPRNVAKVSATEATLREMAKEIAENGVGMDIGFLDPEYEGIPTADIHPIDDSQFFSMAQRRAELLKNPAANASAIDDAENAMHKRCKELAKEMHKRERVYLDPEPEYIPLDVLPLNEDKAFSAMEDELRALTRKPLVNKEATARLQGDLNRRAHELAKDLKKKERDLFLDPAPMGIPISMLPLDTDPQFHAKEVERLRLRHSDPIANESKIRDLEKALNERARELAEDAKSDLRKFLDPAPLGIPLSQLGLDYDDEFMAMENELRQLNQDPANNASAISQLQDKMQDRVNALAAQAAAHDRQFLDPEPEGRLVNTLPLSDHAEFMELDKKRRQAKNNGDRAQMEDIEEQMNDIAHEIAHQLNVQERPEFLTATFRGVDYADLPLDDDQVFRTLEAKRQVQKRDPNRQNSNAIGATEEELRQRAMELALEKLAADRRFLNPEPEGVPLRLLPLSTDPEFSRLEAERAQLKKDPRKNAVAITHAENAMDDRAHELAKELKATERAHFLEPKPNGIPYDDLPLDKDQPFHDMEIQRLVLKENAQHNATAIQELEDSLNDRALELAARMKSEDRAFLDPAILGMDPADLNLDNNPAYLAKEEELRRLKKDPRTNAAAIAKLMDEMLEMAKALAKDEIARSRGFLDPEPEGRLLETLPLDSDEEFKRLENDHAALQKGPKKNAQALADIEELMNERVHVVAKALNAAERPMYLNPAPRGIPFQDLPLDADSEFSNLEAERQRLLRQPSKNRSAIEDIEDALNRRADELAQEKVQSDRQFIDPEPENIPVKYLPLDDDDMFRQLEAERRKLKNQNLEANTDRIRQLEDAMNGRAHEVAKATKQKVREEVLPSMIGGVHRDALPLEEDLPYADLEVALIRAAGDGEDPERAQNLADAMGKRALDVAAKLREKERQRLEPQMGFTPDDLPLDNDQAYVDREAELIALRMNPKMNAEKIAVAERDLNTMALQMAKAKAADERGFLDDQPEGRLLDVLNLDEDPTFRGLEDQYRRVKKDPYADQDRLADLEQMMNDRAHEVARALNAAERVKYMDAAPRHVPLDELPLDTDEEFAKLEAQRAQLCQDPRKNAVAIRQIEDALNDRADRLAEEVLKNDRMYLEDAPETVPLRQVPFEDDLTFSQLEQQRAALKNQGAHKADEVAALEAKLNDRVRDLANLVKAEHRADMEPTHLGIPMSHLHPHLDADEHFVTLEEKYRDAKKDPSRSQVAAQILDQLNERADEIAKGIHMQERAALDQSPEGIPLSVLPLDDPTFIGLENEARAIRNENPKDPRLQQLEDAMNQRAREIANDLRKGYCDAQPEGIPLEMLRLGDDPSFTEAERDLFQLRQNPVANKAKISDLEYELNNKAHEKAKAMMQDDRGYLEPNPNGVAVRNLPLDTDEKFRALEAERARLKADDPAGNSRAIQQLEDRLNERAAELADDVKAAELASLERDPLGIPLDAIAPHGDQEFAALASQLRDLKMDPRRNANSIQGVQDRMNDRVFQIASTMLQGDRDFLEPNPAGVPLDVLPLDSDTQFHKMEVERAKLKSTDPDRNAKKIELLESQMNARALELAEDQQREDLRGLDQKPEGILLSILKPHDDAKFASYLPRLRELKADPNRNAAEISDIQRAMNDRCHELADEMMRKDRPQYLNPNPKDVPLELLPLDTDPKFRQLEADRATLKAKDPVRNATRITDLENQLNARAEELAEEQLKKDFEKLDALPGGIPFTAASLTKDPQFSSLVSQQRSLAQDPEGNASAMRAIQDEMNARAQELGRAMLHDDRAFLDPAPQGVALKHLPLDTDPTFHAMEGERARLKAVDPRRNARQIKELETKLNNRAHELAHEQLNKELRALDQHPRGIPIELLKPHDDSQFRQLAEQLRDSGATGADRELLLEAMNARLGDLADAVLDRTPFLEENPEGVPLSVLPLDSDPIFHQLEVERAKLKLKDPRRNQREIADLENKLNDRAHELAKKQIAEDLSGCDALPEGIPLELLKPMQDEEFASMVPHLRELKKDPSANAEAIKALETLMNNRAYQLADALLEGDRGYLDPAPSGVPLEYLPLEKDPHFATMEVERAKLVAQDPRRNARQIQDLESDLNERALALAEEKKKQELAMFPPQYEGIDTASLRPHDDPAFAQMVNQLREMEKNESLDTPEGKKLLENMSNRLEELAKERKDGDLWFLQREVEGIPIDEVGVSRDPVFEEMREERAKLKSSDPIRNADKIRALEDDMNGRAEELAKEMLNADFAGVNKSPLGIPLELLHPREDPQIASLLPEHRRARESARTADKARALTDKINERAEELAREALAGDRASYLDAKPEGVDLSYLPLDTDPIYHGLEVERAKLKLADSPGNSQQIEDLEDRLNKRSHELALEVLAQDLKNLDQNPEGIPIAAVAPYNNADFAELADQARQLRNDPRRNAAKIAEVEERMNTLAHEMAREMLMGDRDYLDQFPEGVPLTVLPLDADKDFHALEVQRALLKADTPNAAKNAAKIAELEERLNDRANELAVQQKQEDLRGLNSAPRGVPVALLNPHDDPKFASLLPELRRLKEASPANRQNNRIDDIQGQLDDILEELAREYLEKDRASYLDASPEGIPVNLLPLDDDAEFTKLENERLHLIAKDPRANQAAIAELEADLNNLAKAIAKNMGKSDRGYLHPEPEGVPLAALRLDDDRAFTELESRRAALKAKDPVRNAGAIQDLEDLLNDRAHELARNQIAEDLMSVDPNPEGIPIETLGPHSDPEFARMVNALRALKADSRPDTPKIKALEADMNDRVHELADMALRDDRPLYLGSEVEGVKLDKLPLDEDQQFHQLEVERAKLKLADPKRNAAKISDLEGRLHDRATELAKQVLADDLKGLNDTAFGLPIGILRPHSDETFNSLAEQRRSPTSKARGIGEDDTAAVMNDRLEAMARSLLADDRPSYLNPNPCGVPYSTLPLDDDAEFHDMEVQRAILKAEDPRRNADKIAALEDRLNDRAKELATEALSGDRAYLDQQPEGVPLGELPLDTDAVFHQLEVDRANLKADPRRNAEKIAAAEERLNDRAHELARKQLQEDLEGLESNPRGIPLESLNPHADAEFASYLPELRRLKKESGSRQGPRIRDIQAKMNNRADELAKERIAEERRWLDQEPEGIPLALLPLDSDKAFLDMEKQLRRANADPTRNADKIAGLKDRMNDRVHELAQDRIQGDRAYLHPSYDGIPISDIPIDSDAQFREMEAERAKLKEDPRKNADAIAQLEDRLNDRAQELAADVKKDTRAFLKPTSHGIPKELLPLDDDAAFQKMEQQLRRLKRDPRRNGPAIENLQEMMQDRADELGEMIVKGERDKYLDASPEGIPVADLALDTDPMYSEMEVKRGILRATPGSNAAEIAELEKALNDRAQEIAKERRANDRAFLSVDPEYIPITDVPLDDDANFMRLEELLRKLKKDPRRNADAIRNTQENMNDRAHELARNVVADDLACLPQAEYRGIPKESLDLHANPKFSEAANRRRAAIRNQAPRADVDAIEQEMDAIARDVADAAILRERAFLDQHPESMSLSDLPLDTDPQFHALEKERHSRMADPRAAKRNRDIIRDLEDKMNDRAHELAKEEFAKRRGFMDQEPEGVPLSKLPLDTDPEFRDAEVALYQLSKQPNPDAAEVAKLQKRMNDRAHELAQKEAAKDRGFLNPEPEGVPLSYLALESDPTYNALARERQALKHAGGRRDAEKLKALERQMDDRVQEMAKEFLNKNRDFLNPEPQNVPLSEVPLNRDPLFREKERELMLARADPKANANLIARLEEELNDRAEDLSKDMLRRERAMQDQEPLGVPLEELPLNFDPILNPLERRRRELKKDPKNNADALRAVESDIAERVNQIAKDFLDQERAFLDQEPEGVPLSRLPLKEDRDFREMEKELRALKKMPAKNKDRIADLEEQMNERVHELAKEQLAKDRAFLDPEPLGVALADLPLNEDAKFRQLEDERRELKKDPRNNAKAIREVENKLNDRAHELAQETLDRERAFLPQSPHGMPLRELPLDKDKQFHAMEKQLRELKKDPKRNAAPIAELEEDMINRVNTLAERKLADDRSYLNPEPLGVPLADLNLNEDAEFRDLEQRHRAVKNDPARTEERDELEDKLNDRAEQIAANFLKQERMYLDQEPEGVPVDELPLNEDPIFHGMEMDRRKLKKDPTKNAEAILDLEDRLQARLRELAIEKKGYQDHVFHEANESVAEQWPRIRELYPEGVYDAVTPDTTLPSDVCSAPQDMGFLAPFIAALARHTPLITRLFQDTAHPQNQPYRINLFNPDSTPVTVEVDDRVPCDESMNPKFTQVPSRMWYPLLLEKAYAKFVGGYENFNNCNAHDTLRDLTGRPVLHISLEDPKHAAATNMGDYTAPTFWRRVMSDLGRGDIFVCVANGEVPNNIHPLCCYALLDVFEVSPGTSDPNDIVVKVHNCYKDSPVYTGPLSAGDRGWTAEVRRACDYTDDAMEDAIFMPLPIFLDNFNCMQRCHINCGDRLSSPGEWNEFTAGGTSKFTTFRSNPIYLVENKTSRPATILAEVRHADPLYTDETNCKRYPYTGLTLMQPVDVKLPHTPFITSGTHKSLQKGMMLDSREVCMEMELPPSTTCYLIPFTKDRGTLGRFHVSIYPDMAKVSLTPLRHAGLTLKPLQKEVTVEAGPGSEGTRVDFAVNDSCDVHILLHQTKITDVSSVKRGEAIAEDDISMSVFNDYGIRVGSTGDPTNAREHALVFKAPQAGRYSLLISCPATPAGGPCTARVGIYTPRDIEADFASIPTDAKPLSLQSNASRFPTLSRIATAPSRHASRERASSALRGARRTDSVPAAINQRYGSAGAARDTGTPSRRSRSGRR